MLEAPPQGRQGLRVVSAASRGEAPRADRDAAPRAANREQGGLRVQHIVSRTFAAPAALDWRPEWLSPLGECEEHFGVPRSPGSYSGRA